MLGFDSSIQTDILSPIMSLISEIVLFNAAKSLSFGAPLILILISESHFLISSVLPPYSVPRAISLKYSISLSVYL